MMELLIVWVLFWGPNMVSMFDTAIECEKVRVERIEKGYAVGDCHMERKRT